MNFLDYLVNAMTGGQPTQQELMVRKMAEEEAKKQALQGLLSQQAQPQMMQPMPSMQQPAQMSPYMQNLINPSKTMQQNYIDPRLMVVAIADAAILFDKIAVPGSFCMVILIFIRCQAMLLRVG